MPCRKRILSDMNNNSHIIYTDEYVSTSWRADMIQADSFAEIRRQNEQDNATKTHLCAKSDNLQENVRTTNEV